MTSARVAKKLVDAMKKAPEALQQQLGMGSPAIGQDLDLHGLRACRLDGFPLLLWYLECAGHVLVVRLVGQGQCPESLAVTS